MKSNPPITLSGDTIHPGEHRTIMLPMPESYNCAPMFMPVHVLCGRQAGPTLLVTAALHGDEINGVEIARQLLKKKQLSKLSGTLIVIPIVNVYGFIYQSRYLMDRRDLNRSFPGSKTGSLAARLAHLLLSNVAIHATHIIDLHSGSLHRSNLPQIRSNLSTNGNEALARAFGAPVILDATELEGSFRQAANAKGIPFLLFEGGEALRFDKFAVRIGVQGILNILRCLNMLPTKLKAHKHPSTLALSNQWLRAPMGGIVLPKKELGQLVEKASMIALITNPLTGDETPLYAPRTGIIIGRSNLPMVHEGGALFHIAYMDAPLHVSEKIEAMADIEQQPDI